MHLDTFITAALLVILATSIAVALFRHLGLGSILGLLVAGILIGSYSPWPFSGQQVDDIRNFAELGVVLLLFMIGLEMKWSRLWAMRKDVVGLGGLQIVLSGLFIGLYLYWFMGSWVVAGLAGVTLAFSSTAYVLQLLQEKGEITSRPGEAAFSVLLMQDMAVVPLLAVVPIFSETGALAVDIPVWEKVFILIGMFAFLVAVGRYIVPIVLDYLARKGNREGFFWVVMLAVFLAAWSMHQAGVSMALGAFFMGMMLSGSRYRLQIQATIEPYKGLLMSLFFVAIGMSIDFQALVASPLAFAQHTAVIIGIKIVVLFLLAIAFGYSKSFAARISFLLAQGGEFGFVLFGSARILGVIDDATFALGAGVISATMLLPPILVRIGETISDYTAPEEPVSEEENYPIEDKSIPRVVVGGYGRVGRTVAILLKRSGIPFIVFDTNPRRVGQGRKEGYKVYSGDISDPDLLLAAQIEHSSLIVLAVDDRKKTLKAVEYIKSSYPRLPVLARARDLEGADRLRQAGATEVFPEEVECSLYLGQLALEMSSIPKENIDMLLKRVRANNYRLIAVKDRK